MLAIRQETHSCSIALRTNSELLTCHESVTVCCCQCHELCRVSLCAHAVDDATNASLCAVDDATEASMCAVGSTTKASLCAVDDAWKAPTVHDTRVSAVLGQHLASCWVGSRLVPTPWPHSVRRAAPQQLARHAPAAAVNRTTPSSARENVASSTPCLRASNASVGNASPRSARRRR